MLFPETLLSLLFSPRFSDASSYLFVFVLAHCVLPLSSVNQALLVGLNDFRRTVVIVLVGQIALVALALLLVPLTGVAGVGIALLVDYMLVLGLTTLRLGRHHGMAMFRRLGRLVPVALAALAALGALASALPEADPATVAAKVVVATLVGGCGFLVARRALRSPLPAA
jgi:O-antigen/teichoic acid export membrane protein